MLVHPTPPHPTPPQPDLFQALKLDEDGAREEAVLSCLHSALQYAVSGAVAHRSIQCVVLCVFTLHCCRGRGSAEQKQQRQAWHTQLSDALPAGDKAKWAAVGWVDPRLESHATQVRRVGCLELVELAAGARLRLCVLSWPEWSGRKLWHASEHAAVAVAACKLPPQAGAGWGCSMLLTLLRCNLSAGPVWV